MISLELTWRINELEVQVPGFEPGCLAWKAKILTARLHLRGPPNLRSLLKRLFDYLGDLIYWHLEFIAPDNPLVIMSIQNVP